MVTNLPDRGLVVRGRYEQALGRRDLEAQHRWRVEVREENQDVVVLVMALEVVDEAGTPRSLLLQPLHLFLAAVGVMEDPVRVLVERLEVARLRVGETPHGDAADAIGALGVLVFPRRVLARARREHVHLMPLGEVLGDQAAVVLGSAEDLRAVALNDESNTHEGQAANGAST